MSDFSDILFNLRKKQNLTQKDIAEKLNITQRAYSGYETGTREPDIQTILNIAEYFNISVDYLLGRYKANDFLPNRSKKQRKPRTSSTTSQNDIISFHTD